MGGGGPRQKKVQRRYTERPAEREKPCRNSCLNRISPLFCFSYHIQQQQELLYYIIMMADIGFLSSFHLFPFMYRYSYVVIYSKIYVCSALQLYALFVLQLRKTSRVLLHVQYRKLVTLNRSEGTAPLENYRTE